MIRIHSIRLRRHLHLLFIGLFLIATLSIVPYEFWRANATLEQRQQALLRDQIAVLKPVARRALSQTGASDLLALIATLSTRPSNRLIAISDTGGRILYASRYALKGQRITEILPEASSLASSPDTGIHIASTTDGYIAVGGIDYTTAGRHLREHHRALLWIHNTPHRERRQILLHAWQHLGFLLLLGLAGTLLLVYLTKRYIADPLEQLQRLAQRITGGDYRPRVEIDGEGETADLARHLQHLGDTIAKTIGKLREQKEELLVTLNSIGDAVIATDARGRVSCMNPVAEQLTGWPLEEARGKPLSEVFDIIDADSGEIAPNPVERVLREGVVVGLANHTALRARGGAVYQIADSAAPIRTDDGRILGVIMVFQDVTAEYATQQHLRDTYARLDGLANALPDMGFLLNRDGTYLEVFGGDPDKLAHDRRRLIGRCISEVLPEELAGELQAIIDNTLNSGQGQQIDYQLEHPDGPRYFEGRTALLKNGEDNEVIFLARNVTRRHEAEQNVRRLALFDPLTGLPNRHMLESRLKQAISRTTRDNRYGALIFIDLDDFKQINDSLGHALGDRVLGALAERLRRVLREEDLVCRFGGDEFLVLLEQLDNQLILASEYAETIARKLRDTCNTPVEVDDHSLHLSLSIGITLFPDPGAGIQDLVQRADIAMYRAKELGRGRICFFSNDLQQAAEERMRVQQELREAPEDDELVLYLQPLVDSTGAWIGGEVLLRWQHSEQGLILPDAFIPIAEKSGLIASLDDWVIEQAIARLAIEFEHSLPDSFQRLSINLACPTLIHPGFVERLQGRLDTHGLEGSHLEFEITERLLVEDYTQTARVMHGARGLGVHFSIDDFGTGCSTLRYLQRLPLDRIKIDRSFIAHLPERRNDAVLVETLIDLAGHLGLETVAEGVENAAQHEFLVGHGCNSFQGWLFARPMPWESFFTTLRQRPG